MGASCDQWAIDLQGTRALIFLTVGGQLPFDRLVMAVDSIALKVSEPIFGQIGRTKYRPKYFSSTHFLGPEDFERYLGQASVVVGHAGIGTIVTANKLGKPMIMMPRRAALGEHRNDHQLATVAQLKDVRGLCVAETAEELLTLMSDKDLPAPEATVPSTRQHLVSYLKEEVTRLKSCR